MFQAHVRLKNALNINQAKVPATIRYRLPHINGDELNLSPLDEEGRN